MKEVTSTLLGLFAAAAVPAVTFAVLTPVTGGSINTDIVSVLGLSVVFYVFSLAASLVLGSPLFFLFRHYDLVRWWSALISGLLVSAVVAAALRLPSSAQIKDFLVMVPQGAASGLVFWVVWRQGADA